jgi:hypothetical protein
VIGVFHFLTDGDLHSASLVCKVWMDAAFDPAVWEYEDACLDALMRPFSFFWLNHAKNAAHPKRSAVPSSQRAQG